MKKVLFKKWIPAEWSDKANSVNCSTTHRQIEGTNCWQDDFINHGRFHQWANAYEESSAGFGNYTVALVELSDGTITEVLPSNIKFI
jgi:hypothetical protein